MTRVRVKICGVTRRDDALLAVSFGADAIGFVFWPGSPRVVSPRTAAEIAHALPPFVARVGVFVDAQVEDVRGVVREVGLDVVQLHGGEHVEDYASLGVRLISAVGLDDIASLARAKALPEHVTPLVDAVDPARHGGTGRIADWARAADLARARPTILAGGLSAETVADAVQHVRPWAVDVSSGVETSPGVKSADRLRQLFAAVARVRRAAGEG